MVVGGGKVFLKIVLRNSCVKILERFNMWKGNKEKDLFTLSEVARRFNRNEDFFLTMGCDGLINLMIKVPQGAILRLTNQSGHIGAVNLMKMPDFLKLERLASSDLKINNKINIFRSSLGYKFVEGGDLQEITPYQGWDYVEKLSQIEECEELTAKPVRWTHRMTDWTVCSSEENKFIFINRDEVRIHRLEIFRVEKLLYEAIDLDRKTYYSTKLNLMYEAAELFWGESDVIYTLKETHPSRREIEDWFIKVDFSRSAAQVAATIITPDGVTRMGRPSKSDFTHKSE